MNMFAIFADCENGKVKRKAYASDINPEKFAETKSMVRSVRQRKKPATVDMHQVLYAGLYVLRTGQWKLLPNEAHKWQAVYAFAYWSKPGEHGITRAGAGAKSQVGAVRTRLGHNACSAFLVIEVQSVRNTGTAALQG